MLINSPERDLGILNTFLLVSFIFIGKVLTAFFTGQCPYRKDIALHFLLQLASLLKAFFLPFPKKFLNSLFDKTDWSIFISMY